MTYFIDAWLERPQPRLRIINRLTGHVCVKIEGNNLTTLIEQGALDINALCSSEPLTVKEQVRQLFLLGYAQAAGLGVAQSLDT